ncbi:hypothetical protein MIR68_004496 [Amoeboaphelidium protococcarum]|nr:hypothetical protein MIR68_004496 [Amoeboaphelidium protococcarum]
MGKGKGDKLFVSQKEWSRDFKGYRVSGGSDGRVGKSASQQSRRIVHNALAQRVLKDLEKSTDSVSHPRSSSDASNQQSALVLPKPAVGDGNKTEASRVSKPPSSGGVGKYLKLDNQSINQSKSKDITAEKNNGTRSSRSAKVSKSHHSRVGTVKNSQKLSDFSSW